MRPPNSHLESPVCLHCSGSFRKPALPGHAVFSIPPGALISVESAMGLSLEMTAYLLVHIHGVLMCKTLSLLFGWPGIPGSPAARWEITGDECQGLFLDQVCCFHILWRWPQFQEKNKDSWCGRENNEEKESIVTLHLECTRFISS